MVQGPNVGGLLDQPRGNSNLPNPLYPSSRSRPGKHCVACLQKLFAKIPGGPTCPTCPFQLCCIGGPVIYLGNNLGVQWDIVPVHPAAHRECLGIALDLGKELQT